MQVVFAQSLQAQLYELAPVSVQLPAPHGSCAVINVNLATCTGVSAQAAAAVVGHVVLFKRPTRIPNESDPHNQTTFAGAHGLRELHRNADVFTGPAVQARYRRARPEGGDVLA